MNLIGKEEDFLKINPAGDLPVIVDDEIPILLVMSYW